MKTVLKDIFIYNFGVPAARTPYLIYHSPPYSIVLVPITQKDEPMCPQVQVKHLYMIQIQEGCHLVGFRSVRKMNGCCYFLSFFLFFQINFCLTSTCSLFKNQRVVIKNSISLPHLYLVLLSRANCLLYFQPFLPIFIFTFLNPYTAIY